MNAWLFAGHGSQYPGMGRGLWTRWPELLPLLEQAEALSGQALRVLACEGDAHALRQPRCLEPLLLCLSLGYAQLLQSQGHVPVAVAGYSAGLLPALVIAGVMDAATAMALAVRRGELLQAFVEQRAGGLLAVLGAPVAQMLAALRGTAQAEPLDVAGWNSARQLTLSGSHRALAAAKQALREVEMAALEVPVAGPWHGRGAQGLAQRMAPLLQSIDLQRPRIPVYSSVTGGAVADPERWRLHLAVQVEAPVYWQATVASLVAEQRPTGLVEVSAGRSLAGLHDAAAVGIPFLSAMAVLNRSPLSSTPETKALYV